MATVTRKERRSFLPVDQSGVSKTAVLMRGVRSQPFLKERRKMSNNPKPQLLLTGLTFGESPRWHAGRLWVSDWGTRELLAVSQDGKSWSRSPFPRFNPSAWIGYLMGGS